MKPRPETNPSYDELYLAGERVGPGAYRHVGAEKVIVLEREDYLPASLDGRVAVYVLMPGQWGARGSSSGKSARI